MLGVEVGVGVGVRVGVEVGLRATTGWADLYHRQQDALFLQVLAVAQPRWKAREHVAQHLAQVSSSSSKYKGNYHALRLARYTAPSVCTYLLNLYLAQAKDVDGQGGARRQRDEGRDSALQLGRGVTLRAHLCMCICSLLEALRRALPSEPCRPGGCDIHALQHV